MAVSGSSRLTSWLGALRLHRKITTPRSANSSGDADNARDYAKKAAEFYSLPQLNYAFVRAKAQKQEG